MDEHSSPTEFAAVLRCVDNDRQKALNVVYLASLRRKSLHTEIVQDVGSLAAHTTATSS